MPSVDLIMRFNVEDVTKVEEHEANMRGDTWTSFYEPLSKT
jgi:hypothetical protein